MLVLTRALNQEIVIDGDIRIKVVQIRGNHIRLGITAPAAVSVSRQEIVRRPVVQAAGSAAALPRTAERSQQRLTCK